MVIVYRTALGSCCPHTLSLESSRYALILRLNQYWIGWGDSTILMVGNLIFGANRWRRSVSAMLKQMLQQRTGPHLEPPLLVFGGPYSNLRAVLVGRFLRVDVTALTNLFVKAHSISICWVL